MASSNHWEISAGVVQIAARAVGHALQRLLQAADCDARDRAVDWAAVVVEALLAMPATSTKALANCRGSI